MYRTWYCSTAALAMDELSDFQVQVNHTQYLAPCWYAKYCLEELFHLQLVCDCPQRLIDLIY